MNLSSYIAAKISAIFAASGTANAIPLTASGVTLPNNASFDVGFPSVTMLPIPSGGLPPVGADFNGIFKLITALNNFQSAGGLFPYDSGFSTSVGGYPKGAVLLQAAGSGFWQSTVDNNVTDPDTGGAGWIDPVAHQLTGYLTTALAATTYTPLNEFTHGSNANGFWTKRPDGIIEQYGITAAFTSEGGKTITLPIPFTSSINGYGATVYLNSPTDFADQVAQVYSPTLTTLGVYMQTIGGGTPTFPIYAVWFETGI